MDELTTFVTRGCNVQPLRQLAPETTKAAGNDGTNLSELANRYGSDKGDAIYHAHDYAKLYSFLFEEFRNEAFTIVEIGLERSGWVDNDALLTRETHDVPSIRMWLDYFPKATVIGCDISDFSAIKIDRFRFENLDMGRLDSLEQLAESLPSVRIIIDDASHAAYHQQFALAKLFPIVESGGFYIIEDLHSGHLVEKSLPHCMRTPTMIDRFIATKRMDIPFVSAADRRALENSIRKTFFHRSDKGGVDNWSMKMVAFEKG